MIKYYTRACNFIYGEKAKNLIKSKKALPLCGNNQIAFDKIEIFTKTKKKIISEIFDLKKAKKIKGKKKVKIIRDLQRIKSKRANFIKNIDFKKTCIMGVLNLTPDSFSDGGKFNTKFKSHLRIKEMIRSGAQIIDIGGESTRPGAKTLQVEIEWKRVKEVLKNFKKKYKNISLSLDTRKSEIMHRGKKFGVDIFNDVSGFKYNSNSINLIKEKKIAKVFHHMKGTPETMQKNPTYNNVLLDIYDFFEENIKKNKDVKNIILDPGIGFGKKLKHNLTLISKISLFHSLGFPILVGTSRKRFISELAGKNDSKERIGGTLGSVLFLLSQGVQIFRVHNVHEIKQGILIFKKLLFDQ